MSVASYMQATNHDLDARFENTLEDGMMGTDFMSSEGNHYGTNRANGKKRRIIISERLNWTAILGFVSYILLLMAFASPYWLSSYKFTNSAFKRLGLWDFCFHNYIHAPYQYVAKLTGCHWIYSPVYTNIRDWLQPPWFMFVQATTTIALCVDTIGLIVISFMFMQFLVRYQLIVLCVTLLCHMFTTMLLGFATITFYLKAFDRNWIMYPDYNHVDWAFFFALLSMCGNGFASYLYYQEVKVLKAPRSGP